MAINREDLREAVARFLETQDSSNKDVLYTTPRDLAESILIEFDSFLFKADDEKAERLALYQKLKQEFGE